MPGTGLHVDGRWDSDLRLWTEVVVQVQCRGTVLNLSLNPRTNRGNETSVIFIKLGIFHLVNKSSCTKIRQETEYVYHFLLSAR